MKGKRAAALLLKAKKTKKLGRPPHPPVQARWLRPPISWLRSIKNNCKEGIKTAKRKEAL